MDRYHEREFLRCRQEREEELELVRYARGFSVSDRVTRYEWREVECLRVEFIVELFVRRKRHAVAFEPVTYPATWWEAFKLRFFSRWMLGRIVFAAMPVEP